MKCRTCEGEIRLDKRDGKWWPVEIDGSDHCDICSERVMEKVRQQGSYFKTVDGEEGYKWLGKTIWTHQIGTLIVGKNYRPSDRVFDYPPWEVAR